MNHCNIFKNLRSFREFPSTNYSPDGVQPINLFISLSKQMERKIICQPKRENCKEYWLKLYRLGDFYFPYLATTVVRQCHKGVSKWSKRQVSPNCCTLSKQPVLGLKSCGFACLIGLMQDIFSVQASVRAHKLKISIADALLTLWLWILWNTLNFRQFLPFLT